MTGTDILAAIEAAHEEAPRVKVEIPEWKCTLWFPKDITVARQKVVRAGINPSDEGALMASFILHQAQNEDGSSAFEVNAQSRATMEGKGAMRIMYGIMAKVGAPEDVETAKNG
ncbi:hypothetical protein [Shimia sp.]|uniref:hypothetical protein n=1 Tax=Shimia sp. TaxID=1954381 RepID=UPI003B8B84DF